MDSYAVHLVESGEGSPFKSFSLRSDAIAFAEQELREGDASRADVYLVRNTTNAPAAIAAVKMTAAELVDTRVSRFTEAELKRADERASEQAQKDGPNAVLKYLGL